MMGVVVRAKETFAGDEHRYEVLEGRERGETFRKVGKKCRRMETVLDRM